MAHDSNNDHDLGAESEEVLQRRPIPTRAERENIPEPPASPRYQWYRPRMQGFPGEINAYYRDAVPVSIINTLLRVGGRELVSRFVDESPFAVICSIKKNGNAKRALHELLSRELWRGDEHQFERYFRVNGQDIRFGPQEFCLVTGLRFGSSSFNPHGRNHIIPRTSLFHTYYNGFKVPVKQFLKDFTNPAIVLGTEDQYLTGANLLIYYYMLLCRDYDKRCIDDWAWTLVEDPERWATFPWGSWSFQILCHQLGVAKKGPREIGGSDTNTAYHLYGPVWALYFWAFEALPDLGEKCATKLNPDAFPRLRRWQMGHNYADFHYFFNEPTLQVNPSLEPSTEEMAQFYYLSLFEEQDPLVLPFNPNTSHAWKKAPIPQRQTKEARTMARVLDKLRCRDAGTAAQPRGRQPRATRANSEGRGPLPNPRARVSTSKRPRVESSHPERSPRLVCCVHGDPCPQGCDNDAWADKIMERMAQDQSDTGVMARIAKFMAGHLKGIFGRSGSSAGHGAHSHHRAPSHASHVAFDRRHSVDRPHDDRDDQEAPYIEHRSPSPVGAPGFEHMVGFVTEPVARERSRTPPVREAEIEDAESSHSSFYRDLDRMPPYDWVHPVLQPVIPHPQTIPVSDEQQRNGGEYSDADSDVAGQTPVRRVRVGGRNVRPSAALQSPFVPIIPTPYTGSTMKEMYMAFRRSGPDSYAMNMQDPPYRMTQSLFDDIEHPAIQFTAEVMELYVLYWWSRLQDGLSLCPSLQERSTVLLGLGVYYDLRRTLMDFHDRHINTGAANGTSPFYGFSRENGLKRGNGECDFGVKEKGNVRIESVIESASLAACGQPFEVVYYPRGSTPEFVVRASSVRAAMRVSWCPGMRFKMAFETEDSSRISWFMGTISNVLVDDPNHWPNSPWRLLQVAWDEPDLLHNVKRVNPWLVELVSSVPALHLSPFSPPNKRPRLPQTSEFPFGQFLMPTLLNNNPLSPISPLCCLPDNISTGIQGARHAQFVLSSSTDLHINKLQKVGLRPFDFKPLDYGGVELPKSEASPHSAQYPEKPVEAKNGVRTPIFVLFGQPILTEEQISQSCSDNAGNTSNASGSAVIQNSPPEASSDEEFPRLKDYKHDHCKVFMESEDVGRTLDLLTLGSYEELHRKLTSMFGKSTVSSNVVYSNGVGEPKLIGDEPFRDFATKARRLTILTDSSRHCYGNK